MIGSKYGHDPYDSEAASSQERNSHGHDRKPHTPETAHGNVHDPAQEICREYDSHPSKSEGYNSLFLRIDPEKLSPEGKSSQAHAKPRYRNAEQTDRKRLPDSFYLSGSHVLSGKA